MPITEASGTPISWEESGAGDPILLIMGATFSRRMWHRTVPALAARHRVIWFDNRGFGESGPTTGPYTVTDLARDALAVLDAANVDSAHVYGVSMGGLTAQEVVLSQPQRVRSLVLGCTWAAATDRRRAAWSNELRHHIPQRLMLSMSTPVLYGPRRNKSLIREDMTILRNERRNPRELSAQAKAAFTYESRHRLADVQAPALVIHGDHDRVIPFAWGRELADQLPNARFLPLPGAGHMYLTDNAEAANDAVLDFLSSKQPTPRRDPQRKHRHR